MVWVFVVLSIAVHVIDGVSIYLGKPAPGVYSSPILLVVALALSADGDRINATYYWENLEALREFSNHPKHLQAKRQYRQWYDGYHIVISEILRSYGDGAFDHFTSNDRRSTSG